nr:hypothetical protein CFP56_62874 [Quercus suber]
MAKSMKTICQAATPKSAPDDKIQGPAASNFFGSPELVATMLETGVFSSKDLFSNLRVNKFFNQSIKASPTLQRRMGLRYLADKDIPKSHVDRHNSIVDHLTHYFLDAEKFELRPYEMIGPDTKLMPDGQVFRIHFERDHRKPLNITRRNCPLGPFARKTSSKYYDDHGKHIYAPNDDMQSWEKIFVSPFPIEIEIKVTEIVEVDSISKCRRLTRIRERFSNFNAEFEKDRNLTLGHVVALVDRGRTGRWGKGVEEYEELHGLGKNS